MSLRALRVKRSADLPDDVAILPTGADMLRRPLSVRDPSNRRSDRQPRRSARARRMRSHRSARRHRMWSSSFRASRAAGPPGTRAPFATCQRTTMACSSLGFICGTRTAIGLTHRRAPSRPCVAGRRSAAPRARVPMRSESAAVAPQCGVRGGRHVAAVAFDSGSENLARKIELRTPLLDHDQLPGTVDGLVQRPQV